MLRSSSSSSSLRRRKVLFSGWVRHGSRTATIALLGVLLFVWHPVQSSFVGVSTTTTNQKNANRPASAVVVVEVVGLPSRRRWSSTPTAAAAQQQASSSSSFPILNCRIRPVDATTTRSLSLHSMEEGETVEEPAVVSVGPVVWKYDSKSSCSNSGSNSATLLRQSSDNNENNNNNDKKEEDDCSAPIVVAAAAAQTKDAYALHVGRALDTLRADYPHILTRNPDFSLYDESMECVDPALVTLHGLGKYKAAFDVLHAVVKIIYCPARSSLTFRMCYDTARDHIRIHWNAILQPRDVFGGTALGSTHVDGISVYTLNPSTGRISQHRIEHLLYNDRPVMLPAEGVMGLLLMRRQEKEGTAVSIPSFIGTATSPPILTTAEFRRSGEGSNPYHSPSSLFAMEAEQHADGSKDSTSQSSSKNALDWNAALETKNKSRQKFGLAPLSPEEFMELQDAVSQLDATMQEQQQVAAVQRAEKQQQQTKSDKKKQSSQSLMDKLFGGALTDTCESNFDCERPTVCCDFGFVKKCCSSGSRVNEGLQYARIPVYAGENDPSSYPRGNGPSDRPRSY